MKLAELHGTAHYILVFELCAASLLALAVFTRAVARQGIFALWNDRAVFSKLFLSLLLFLLFYGQWLSAGSPIAAVSIAMPGSLLTRSYSADISLWLRRFAEPSLWLLILSLFVASADSLGKVAHTIYFRAACLLTVILAAESFMLSAPVKELISSGAGETVAAVVHYALLQVFMLFLIVGGAAELWESKARQTQGLLPQQIIRRLSSVAVGFIALTFFVDGYFAKTRPLMVGAHYYSWFPENWRGGFIGTHLKPPVLPELGLYHSDDPEVFDRHIDWAKEAGIDFFIFDWWPQRPEIRRRAHEHIVERKALNGLQFSVHYESLDVKERGDKTFPGEEPNVAYMTEERAYRLKKHWEHLALHYLGRPEYLTIDDRPVIFVYASRHLVGPVGKAISEARRHVKETTGISLYLVGDEVFFNALSFSERKGLLLLPQGEPDWDRLTAFDAITTYNPYDASRTHHGGSEGAELFLSDVAALFKRYRALATTAGIRFFPGVLAAYNDRGVRPGEDHFVVPREFGPEQTSFFFESLRRWGLAFLDRDYPLFAVTSWNEWNEGTQIEPTRISPPTAKDDSGEQFYTLGEVYEGYGKRYLEQLAEIRSIWGSK